jgi:hypothetical protein
MQVIKSNNVPANKVVALHNSAVGYGKQIWQDWSNEIARFILWWY